MVLLFEKGFIKMLHYCDTMSAYMRSWLHYWNYCIGIATQLHSTASTLSNFRLFMRCVFKGPKVVSFMVFWFRYVPMFESEFRHVRSTKTSKKIKLLKSLLTKLSWMIVNCIVMYDQSYCGCACVQIVHINRPTLKSCVSSATCHCASLVIICHVCMWLSFRWIHALIWVAWHSG